MAEGRGRSLWGHTASVLALIANVNRDPKKTPRPFKPGDFNPFAVQRSAPLTVEKLTREILAVGRGRERKARREARTGPGP